MLAPILELIPGTPEYKSRDRALQVMKRWEQGSTVYSQLQNRILNNKDFYEGLYAQQFNSSSTVDGNIKITANMGATVLDLIVFLLSNNMPSLQALPRSTQKTDQVEASIAESLIEKAFRDANFKTTYKDSVKMFIAFAGFFWWFPFWNTETEFGKKKNHVDMTLLPPLTTRVFYETTDYKKVSSFITTKRLLPETVYKLYGIHVSPDSENPILPHDITGYGLDDGKVTVFKEYDEREVVTVIDNMEVESMEHGLDFAPLIQANNVWLLNEAHGQTDLFRFLPIAQELNVLMSAASEIARDKAWPALIEYNGALGGKKVGKWRNQKVQARRTDKGESLQFLENPADIQALLAQIQLLLDIFHFVSLMPKAAAGIFESTVTSGFQAKLAMQPATLSTENKRITIDAAIERLAKTFLYLIEKNDPQALQISDSIRLVDLYEIDFKVVWPENLPVDIAREIQNLAVGIDKSLTSVTQSIDKYNVLMGMGSTEDTLSYLKQESLDPEINPDRVMKITQVQQMLSQIQQATASIREKVGGGVLPPQTGTPEDAEMSDQNSNNLQAGLDGPSQEPTRPPVDTAQEAVNSNSTGGVPIGGGLQG